MADTPEFRDLRVKLSTLFTKDELNTLCFDIGIDYDNFTGGTKATIAREIIKEAINKRRLAALLETARQERPEIQWPEIREQKETETFPISNAFQQGIRLDLEGKPAAALAFYKSAGEEEPDNAEIVSAITHTEQELTKPYVTLMGTINESKLVTAAFTELPSSSKMLIVDKNILTKMLNASGLIVHYAAHGFHSIPHTAIEENKARLTGAKLQKVILERFENFISFAASRNSSIRQVISFTKLGSHFIKQK